MEELRQAFIENAPLYLMISGLVVGFAFGCIVYATNFCTMGGISDAFNFGDYRRFRSWILAGAVAILGTQALAYTGIVSVEKSMYLGPSLNWSGHILGGLIFGFGMVFSGGCPSRNLARAGGGDLRALLTLVVVGIFAYATIGGVLGPLRAAIADATALPMSGLGAPSTSLADMASAHQIVPGDIAGLAVGAIIAGLMMLYCFASREMRASPVHIIAGIAVGLCVIAGWAATGLAFDEFTEAPVPPISLTYVRPAGDSLEWIQRYTALGYPGFGAASVFGALFGAFLAAMSMGRFRVASFSDAGDTVRTLSGAALMGFGGVMALGCTIGQGLTGISTLALGSYLTFVAIVLGGILGLKALERLA
ncbi:MULTISPECIES: YeeE/YedE family protein [Filomicrobium]|uniref:Sulphur transport domain-containing protein n=1 Tax=Filomicrobium insigne TaxID=418854 RepID=A0A1H0T6X8_9HYPH|nr:MULTISPECIES: YeeE/YedE family protein [Filomicrobium]MCV0370952.1 YeeE/YedE family protein [Filomicrobium sp.]SDP49797.1 hypothetical protein SAMN04488061_3188 [Filomicrobium insigne]